jgi:putative transposase
MSRTGNCYDNAVVESFFGSLKTAFSCDAHPSRVVATATIGDYIDNFYNFYNPKRRHSSLDYLSPIEFELRAQSAPLAA